MRTQETECLKHLKSNETYENTILTPPFSPLSQIPLPRPPAKTWALTTTSVLAVLFANIARRDSLNKGKSG